jgi:hypothetical protein
VRSRAEAVAYALGNRLVEPADAGERDEPFGDR